MRSFFLVMKHEISTTLRKRSYWIMTFIFPLILLAANVLPQLLAGDSFNQNPMEALSQQTLPTGYVDASGLIVALPPGLPPDQLRAFTDDAAAQAALAAGEIGQYYRFAPDFLTTGDVELVATDFNAFGSLINSGMVDYLVNYNLVHDPQLAALLIDPTASVESHALAPSATGSVDGEFGFYLPIAVMFILFFVITFSAGYMLQSVTREKENRTAEVLLLSLRPRDLMLGKVIGLGVVALLQMLIWLGGGLIALTLGAQSFDALNGFSLPAGFAVITLAYFLLGYLLYASAQGAIGALAPTAREGAQFTFVIILPLLIPFWMNSAFVADPNSDLVTALSLIPFTAPTAMVARMASTTVPTAQIAISLLGLVITTYLFVLLAARFFRADTLLSDTALTVPRLLAELRPRRSRG